MSKKLLILLIISSLYAPIHCMEEGMEDTAHHNQHQALVSEAIFPYIEASISTNKDLDDVIMWSAQMEMITSHPGNDDFIKKLVTWQKEYQHKISKEQVWNLINHALNKSMNAHPNMQNFFIQASYFWHSFLKEDDANTLPDCTVAIFYQLIEQGNLNQLSGIAAMVTSNPLLYEALNNKIQELMKKTQENGEEFESFFNAKPMQMIDDQEKEVNAAIAQAVSLKNQASINKLLDLHIKYFEHPIFSQQIQEALNSVYKKSNSFDSFSDASDQTAFFENNQPVNEKRNPHLQLQINDAIKTKNLDQLMNILDKKSNLLSCSQRTEISLAIDKLSSDSEHDTHTSEPEHIKQEFKEHNSLSSSSSSSSSAHNGKEEKENVEIPTPTPTPTLRSSPNENKKLSPEELRRKRIESFEKNTKKN